MPNLSSCYREPYAQGHRRRHSRRVIVCVLGIIVALATFYALILPAITMEKTDCGAEEHIHTEECYEKVLSEQQPELSCSYTSLGVHVHTEQCYDSDGCQICNTPDYVAHTHNESCIDDLGTLICQLPELTAHSHTEACYDIRLDADGAEQAILICTEPIAPEHTHDNNCYAIISPSDSCEDFLTCTQEENHTHTEICFDENDILVCLEEEGHIHGNLCYGTWKLICQKEEHIHDDSCLKEYDTEPVQETVADVEQAPESQPVEDQESAIEGTEPPTEESEYAVPAADETDSAIEETETVAENTEAVTDVTAEEEIVSDVDYVISLIEQIPSADEIDTTLMQFSSNDDCAGEEAYYTAVMLQVSDAYTCYSQLSDEEKSLVVNADKLLELEYIWSVSANAWPGSSSKYYVWLDGTCGGLMSYTSTSSSANSLLGSYSKNTTTVLPTTWDSPSKYHYVLTGWYDIVTGTYYEPGATLNIGTQNHVLYADWVPATYDIGFDNSYTVNSLNTSEFITTHVFDYNVLFNMYSTTYSGSASSSSHSESWDVARFSESAAPVSGGSTLGFIFRDWDSRGDLSYPTEADTDWNKSSTGSTGITTDILSDSAGQKILSDLFTPSNADGVLGKTYVGQGNYFYQYMTDDSLDYDGMHNGYYYYDSTRNAASYNQSDGRFYIYNYLERTSDSLKDGVPAGTAGAYSDFLPFNSPYANTNGQDLVTYSAGGKSGNYQYDAKYNGQESLSSRVSTNYWFGFSSAIDFYIPNDTGYRDSSGYGNQSTTGMDMTFEFSGDDDVWVFIDDQLVLDLGGMHDIVSGSINFSTGEVINAGTTSRLDLEAGDHTLTIYYLERGASQANCRIYFNIAPRYNVHIQKEDFSSQALLNGAEFTVYMDAACTTEAELWTSESSYNSGTDPVSVFQVENGEATLWGFSSGNTYYIKETKAPDGGYSLPTGLIQLNFNTKGDTTYNVLMVTDPEGNAPTEGFTAYGFRIDPETESAYLTITNAPVPPETVSVSVEKVWDGGTVHPNVIVNLLANGELKDSITLSESNSWSYTWDSLPQYADDGVTEISYTVSESATPGYTGAVELISSTDDDYRFRITNTLVQNLQVRKQWDTGVWDTDAIYQNLSVSVKLLADGADTGKSVTLTAENNWTAEFSELPIENSAGGAISYTVEEILPSDDWEAAYSPVTAIAGSESDYEVIITNTYNVIFTLPETGGAGTTLAISAGLGLMLLSLLVLLWKYTRHRNTF